MKVDSYKCDGDGCGVQKAENNHWHKFVAFSGEGKGAGFTVTEWESKRPESPETKHFCSDACVIKAVQQWLSAQKEASQKGE